jgi:prefoldin subunit 5
MELNDILKELTSNIEKLNLKLKDANNKIADLNKRNELLQQQLMQLLKQTSK